MPDMIGALQAALNAGGDDLAPAALAIARLEHPRLDPDRCLQQLDAFGQEAASRVSGVDTPLERLIALNRYLFGTLGFAGYREQYLDPRNSFLNDVIELRIGIPITLSIVYIEVGRRAGLALQGVGFPGHFLVRWDSEHGSAATEAAGSGRRGARGAEGAAPLTTAGGRGAKGAVYQVIDPFNSGTLLSDFDCHALLRKHAGETAVWTPRLLDPASRHAIVVRMLGNLKRAYIALRSFEHARRVSDLLLAVDPSGILELRDRGLLSYHLQDFSLALKDLETYLQLESRREVPSGRDAEEDDPEREEHKALWEHVKNLRRRVASFN